jgi:hypothetical protein
MSSTSKKKDCRQAIAQAVGAFSQYNGQGDVAEVWQETPPDVAQAPPEFYEVAPGIGGAIFVETVPRAEGIAGQATRRESIASQVQAYRGGKCHAFKTSQDAPQAGDIYVNPRQVDCDPQGYKGPCEATPLERAPPETDDDRPFRDALHAWPDWDA